MRKYNYIYKITNIINGKIYIGKHSTDNLNDGYMGSGILINKAIQKYGIENFTKEYIAFCDTEEKLNWFERFYIKKYHSRVENGNYNLTDGGDGSVGYKYNSEQRKARSEQCKGRIFSEEHKQHLKDAKQNISEETRTKLSKALKGKESTFKGRHHTEETKQKLRESALNQFTTQGHPFKGRHHTEEAKKKMSESHQGNNNRLGTHCTEETKEKIRLSHIGKFDGENNPFYGKHHTEETKQKLRKPKSTTINMCKPKRKALWQKPNGETIIKSSTGVQRWHPDWIKIQDIDE